MTPYIATVNYYEHDIDADLHRQNFIIYAYTYAEVMRRVGEYVGDSDIESVTITCVAEPGTLVSVSDEVTAHIIENEGWYSDVVK